MDVTQPVTEVLQALATSSDRGLAPEEAKQRLTWYGSNELPQKRASVVRLLLTQFNDVMVYILLVALVVSTIVPFFEHAPITVESFLDSIVILAILLLNAALGFAQEYRAEQAIKLLAKLSAPNARVRRGGAEQMVPSRELVPGDIVVIEEGDRISADGRILKEAHLQTNESSLTGESGVADKTAAHLEKLASLGEQRNMVFSGTSVTRGSGEYVVTTTGTHTEIGTIAKLVSETVLPETPLARRMKELGALLGTVVIVLCVIIVGVGMYEGRPLFDMLLTGLSLAVSAVPEGLPAVVTVCLAMGVRRMVKRNALVRRLDALETLGSVTVICADKTGTITENRMKVIEAWLPESEQDEERGEKALATAVSSCNRAQLPNLGDPTEVGLLNFAKDTGATREPIDDETVPFSSEEKYMKTRHGDHAYLKGAPEKIVSLCDGIDAEPVLQANEKLAKKGLRVLAGAEERNGRTTFLGLVAMEDPPRTTVKGAIAEAKIAGIRTIMITGDNLQTARAIAKQIGIEGDAIEGEQLDAFNKTQLQQLVRTTSVFARVSPQHKLHILHALQENKEIVAMSGDGVNDAPALKGAHVGVAMGKIGTEVARDASSIVLADDDYATIVEAIREGRRIYDNIRKFVIFLLRANFDEILFIMTTLLLGLPLPYLPIHILWINLMTDGLPALALGMEKEEPDIMQRKPRPSSEHILSGEAPRLLIAALLGFAVSLLLYLHLLSSGVDIAEARTAALTLAINFELFMVFSIRSRWPLWKIGVLTNRWLLAAVAVPFLLQFLVLFTPLRVAFALVPLTPGEWLEIFALSIVGLVVFEGMKVLQTRVQI